MEATLKSLVLSRKRNQSVYINGGEIIVTMADIRGDKVRLLFQAAESVRINRKEVEEAMQREGDIGGEGGTS